MIGYSFGARSRGIRRLGSFDRASLALTGLWSNFSASPWVGSPSAGVSGDNDLSEATNPPAAGATVNGRTPADFDGTNDELDAEGTANTYFNAQTLSGWILFNADAVNTNNATTYENDCLITTRPSAYFTVFLKSTGEIGIRFVPTAESIVTSTFTIGAWQLVQWKYDGATIRIRVNGGAWQSAAATGNFGDLANTLHFGTNYSVSAIFDGKILEIGLTDIVLSDGTFDNILSGCRVDYALSL